MATNMVILGKFDCFSIKMKSKPELDYLDTGRKLAYLVNHDGAVIDRDIFCYNIYRSDFPEIFDSLLVNMLAFGFRLKYVELFKGRIDFVVCLDEDAEKTFRIGVPIGGTSGGFQIREGKMRFVTVEWDDGVITKAKRNVCQGVMSASYDIEVPDEK